MKNNSQGLITHNATEMAQTRLRDVLAKLIAERGESLSQFGSVLAKTIDPTCRPFSRQRLYGLLKGTRGFAITEPIARALETLAALQDQTPSLQARAFPVTVALLSLYILPANTIILGQARHCELPGCQTSFVPTNPAQRYCCPECRREQRRRRKQASH